MGGRPKPLRLGDNLRRQGPRTLPKILRHIPSRDPHSSIQGCLGLEEDEELFNSCIDTMKRLADEHLNPTLTLENQPPIQWARFREQLVEELPLMGEFGEEIWPAKAYVRYWHYLHNTKRAHQRRRAEERKQNHGSFKKDLSPSAQASQPPSHPPPVMSSRAVTEIDLRKARQRTRAWTAGPSARQVAVEEQLSGKSASQRGIHTARASAAFPSTYPVAPDTTPETSTGPRFLSITAVPPGESRASKLEPVRAFLCRHSSERLLGTLFRLGVRDLDTLHELARTSRRREWMERLIGNRLSALEWKNLQDGLDELLHGEGLDPGTGK
ncbi:hypothetical protein ACG7TL_002801 [Trametes sanguinea]